MRQSTASPATHSFATRSVRPCARAAPSRAAASSVSNSVASPLAAPPSTTCVRSPASHPLSLARHSGPESARTTMRQAIASRPCCSVRTRSGHIQMSSRCCPIQAVSASTRRRSASGSRAESGTASVPVVAGGERSCRCHSSRSAWALLPPSPKELTAARRGPSAGFGNGAALRCRRKGVASSRSIGLGEEICRLGTNWPCSRQSTDLINPAIPEAGSRWPMLDFTADKAQNLSVGRLSPRSAATAAKALDRASTSMGSPSEVPVPWASTWPTDEMGTPDRRRTSAMSADCAAGLGAVRLLARPPWFSPLSRITARIVSPSAIAFVRGFRITMPTPSPRT